MGELVYNNGYCGLEIDFRDDMDRLLAYHVNSDFHFVFIPLVDPAYKSSLLEKGTCSKKRKLEKGTNVLDLSPFAGYWFLNTREWSNPLVGKISSWIDLDSDDEMLRKASEITLREEVQLASMLSLQACLLPAPKGSSCTNYIRNVNQILHNLCSMQLLLRIPLVPDDDFVGEKLNYTVWKSFHRQCEVEFHNRLSVAYDFPCSLPLYNTSRCGDSEKEEFHRKVLLFFKHSIKIVLSGTHVHNVCPEILASNASSHARDYGWHPLQMQMAYIISLHGFINYYEREEEYKRLFGNKALSEDDDYDDLVGD